MAAQYPLAGLLTLRDLREENAARALKAAEAETRAAAEARADQEKKLAEYRAWRSAETERRYRAIMGQTLSRAELDEFKAGLARLDERELAEIEELMAAEAALEEAEKKTLAARELWRATDRARRKLMIHRDEWRATEDLEADRREDNELEEFKPVLFLAAAE